MTKFHRQNCGRFLIGANSYSMQMRMLNIISLYLRREQDFDMIIGPFAFIGIFDNVINITKNVTKAMSEIFNQTTVLTFIEKHRILDLLNDCSKKRSIYSIPIKSLNTMEISGAHTREVYKRNGHLVFFLISHSTN